MASLIINITHQNGTFVTTDEPTLIHRNHPKSIVYLRVCSWYCTFCEFGQMYKDIIHHYNIIPSNFSALQICALPVHSLTLSSIPGNHWSFYCLHSFAFFQNVVVSIILHVGFSDWLLSVSHMHLRFLHVFLRDDSSFLLVLNNIPLSVGITVYPFTYWRTSWLLPSFGSFE